MARSWVNRAGDLLLFSVILLGLGVIGVLIHELGHGLMVVVFGGDVRAIYVYPGIEVYPQFGGRFPGGEYNYFGSISSDFDRDIAGWQSGWIDLMGSGSTLLVALVAHGLLWWCKPASRLPRYALVALALFYVDLVTYTLGPQLGLPRAILFGRPMSVSQAEPLLGANALGVSTPVFNLFNVVLLFGLSYSVLRFLQSGSQPN